MIFERRLTWMVTVGVALVFLGERILGAIYGESVRVGFAGAGAAIVALATAWRAWVWIGSPKESRFLSALLFACYAGCLAAIVLYFAGQSGGARWLGIAFQGTRAAVVQDRYEGIVAVLWPILLTASLLPAWAAQLASAGPSLEAHRIREASSAGLTVALATALVFVLGFIADQRDYKVDVSYFKTSSPGTATQNMFRTAGAPMRVLLFFPEISEVKDEVKSYFESLARATGALTIEEYDRMLSPKIAENYGATRDGTIVLVLTNKRESLLLDVEPNKARPKLRTLDDDVQKTFMKIARGPRVAYWMGGHGELSDRSRQGRTADGLGTANWVKEALKGDNYEIKDLGLAQGSAQEVPDDADMVVLLGPKTPLLDEELSVLDRYLDGGGALLLALDPESEAILGPLEARLGIRFDPTPLADDKRHLPSRMNSSDHRLLVTDQFSTHDSVKTLGKSGPGNWILLANSGSLEDGERGDATPKRTYVVRSLTSTFADRNGNNLYDVDETRAARNLVAAVEEGGSKAGGRRMRTMIFADAELFCDALLVKRPAELNRALVEDSLRWLGGEEKYAGNTQNEKDITIEHTQGQDKAWFYAAILGAPMLVLGGGLFGVWRRLRRLRRHGHGQGEPRP